MTVSDYRRLFKYEFWANRMVAKALTGSSSPSIELFSHILASQRLWLDRLLKQAQTMAVWPVLGPGECTDLLRDLEDDWTKYLDGLADEALSERYDYINTKGQAWSSNVADTLTHLLTHSCYHRGQIALRMRLAGEDPPYTDFIQITREGLI